LAPISRFPLNIFLLPEALEGSRKMMPLQSGVGISFFQVEKLFVESIEAVSNEKAFFGKLKIKKVYLKISRTETRCIQLNMCVKDPLIEIYLLIKL
jgi:hypothetical protein